MVGLIRDWFPSHPSRLVTPGLPASRSPAHEPSSFPHEPQAHFGGFRRDSGRLFLGAPQCCLPTGGRAPHGPPLIDQGRFNQFCAISVKHHHHQSFSFSSAVLNEFHEVKPIKTMLKWLIVVSSLDLGAFAQYAQMNCTGTLRALLTCKSTRMSLPLLFQSMEPLAPAPVSLVRFPAIHSTTPTSSTSITEPSMPHLVALSTSVLGAGNECRRS